VGNKREGAKAFYELADSIFTASATYQQGAAFEDLLNALRESLGTLSPVLTASQLLATLCLSNARLLTGSQWSVCHSSTLYPMHYDSLPCGTVLHQPDAIYAC
jgi:hypothetical protein